VEGASTSARRLIRRNAFCDCPDRSLRSCFGLRLLRSYSAGAVIRQKSLRRVGGTLSQPETYSLGRLLISQSPVKACQSPFRAKPSTARCPKYWALKIL